MYGCRKEGKEVVQIKGISLDKEKSDEHMVSLEKLSTLETVCLLSKWKTDTTVKLGVDMDDYYRIINGKDTE